MRDVTVLSSGIFVLISSTFGLFKLVRGCIRRWSTGIHVGCVLMDTMAAHAGTTIVCIDDSDYFWLTVRRCYSSFPEFKRGFSIFQRQTLTSLYKYHIVSSRIGSERIPVHFPFCFRISVWKTAASTNVSDIYLVVVKYVVLSSNVYSQISNY